MVIFNSYVSHNQRVAIFLATVRPPDRLHQVTEGQAAVAGGIRGSLVAAVAETLEVRRGGLRRIRGLRGGAPL